MVEKTGHKTTMRSARLQWIDETKPRAATPDDDEDNRIYRGAAGPQLPDRVAPIFEDASRAAGERAKTPTADDLFGDDDIYNATPVRNTASTAPARQVAGDDVPDDDDLDALMAEAESEAKTQQPGSAAPFESIFGNGTKTTALGPAGVPDDDDLDALMAEAEAQSGPTRPNQPVVSGSIFGDGKPKQQPTHGSGDDGDDLDALMAEAEAEAATEVNRPSQPTGGKAAASGSAQPAAKGADFDDEDDLDALMAEAEAEADGGARPSDVTKKPSSTQADTGHKTASFEEDEEAMAELDGLW
jgi:replication fork protection complex subunit Csm3/Swi3